MGHAVVSVPLIMKLNTQISILCHMSVTPLCFPYSNKVENSTANFPLLWTTSAGRRSHSIHLNCGLQHVVAIQTIRYCSSRSGEHASRYAEPVPVHTSAHHITPVQTQLSLKTTWSYSPQRIWSDIISKYNRQTLEIFSDIKLDFRLKRYIFLEVSSLRCLSTTT